MLTFIICPFYLAEEQSQLQKKLLEAEELQKVTNKKNVESAAELEQVNSSLKELKEKYGTVISFIVGSVRLKKPYFSSKHEGVLVFISNCSYFCRDHISVETHANFNLAPHFLRPQRMLF